MIYEGMYLGKGKRFAIVISRFNDFIGRKLLEGAEDALLRHDVKIDDIDVYYVPGAYEIPSVAKRAAFSGKYNAVLTLGAVIRGETPHFDFVASEVAKGVAQVSLAANVPVLFGVLTTDNIEQAVERAGTKAGNKGFDVALSALEMSNLYDSIDIKELKD